MKSKILVIMTVISSVTNFSDGSPHHHDDPYKQAHRLLKEARKAQRYQALYQYQPSSQIAQFQNRPSGGSSGGGSSNGSPPNPILTPGSSSGSFGTVGSAIPSAGGSSSNYPPLLPNVPSGSQIAGQLGLLPLPPLPQRPPYPIEQVNRGVSTILNGVRSFDLGQILRGAFVFPRNENVRSVANNVIDSIFGAAKSTPTGGSRI